MILRSIANFRWRCSCHTSAAGRNREEENIMKIILIILTATAFVFAQTGCSTHASLGNRDQHGAGVSAKTRGAEKGVHANVY